MTTRVVMMGTLVAGLAQTASGQLASPAPQTAAGRCKTEAAEYQNAKVGDLRLHLVAVTPDVMKPITAAAKRVARECANKISMKAASPAELIALSSVYLYTNDTSKASDAVARLLARPGLSESDRADAVIAAEQLAIAAFDPFAGINADAEKYVAQVDVMSDAVLAEKIRAHELLLGRYEYADNDDGLRDHARKLLVLGNRALAANALGMTPPRAGVPPVNAAYPVIASAYSSLARAAGDFLHADSALMILDEADRAIGAAFPRLKAYLGDQRAMYKLVGASAAPIDGKWWINAPDGSTFVPGSAQVTVIQFTAHWCVPCKNSYPGFMRMAARFAGKPFESIMVTDTYGFIGDKAPLKPEQEVAEDREYYVTQHGLPFKIAINPPLARNDTGTQNNNRRYAVNGIPEIIVVDRKGVIRAMVVGWDKGNEERLSALVEKILAEK